MRLVTFTYEDRLAIGALTAGPDGERVYDLNRLDPRIPAEMVAFLEAGDEAHEWAVQALAAAPADGALPLSGVTLRAPILRPGKIIGIGQNYLDHAKESQDGAPPFPIIFAKWANAIVGPGEPIVVPPTVTQPDYEGELGVVIGRPCRDVAEADALDYVAGYLAVNDVSARDWQFRTGQWSLGKAPDTFCPIGPALVTADEIPDVQNLGLRTVVSGEVLQEGHTSNMIFTVAHLIWDMARIMTLEPGDIIATGTPSGVGFARKPPRWLRHGDVVRIEIEQIGALENPVIVER